MPEPQACIRLGDCDVLLLGTIPGFVPDAERVQAAFAGHRPDAVALGIPPEDLEGLARLAAAPVGTSVELDLLDESEARLQAHLERFGPVRIPSPDLEAAHRLTTAAGLPILALDLDDETHSAHYTRLVKVRHLLGASSRRKKAYASRFEEATSAYDLAVRWDRALTGDTAQAEVERERERHMAQELRAAAARHRRVLAVVPVSRLAGVLARLQGA